jgi:hypothetical protein
MDGVTTAIVLFLLFCVVFPTIVKNKAQYYAAYGMMLVVILLAGLEAVINTPAFHAFATFMIALMQVGALLLLILAAGGLTIKQLAGEVSDAIEVIRRGETTKEVIIPLSGQIPRQKPDAPATPTVRIDDSGSSVPLE